MELLARSIRLLAGSGGFGCILSAEAGAFFDSRMIKKERRDGDKATGRK
jgi:hypothetical protein